jgi:hypothetical protein
VNVPDDEAWVRPVLDEMYVLIRVSRLLIGGYARISAQRIVRV